jgi:hypothetical protein
LGRAFPRAFLRAGLGPPQPTFCLNPFGANWSALPTRSMLSYCTESNGLYVLHLRQPSPSPATAPVQAELCSALRTRSRTPALGTEVTEAGPGAGAGAKAFCCCGGSSCACGGSQRCCGGPTRVLRLTRGQPGTGPVHAVAGGRSWLPRPSRDRPRPAQPPPPLPPPCPAPACVHRAAAIAPSQRRARTVPGVIHAQRDRIGGG